MGFPCSKKRLTLAALLRPEPDVPAPAPAPEESAPQTEASA